MEQTNQQIIQKSPLPIKTKIAAWWMMIISGFIIIRGLSWPLRMKGTYIPPSNFYAYIFVLSVYLPVGLLVFFLPALFLFKRKKWGWYWAIITLFLGMGICTYIFPLYEYLSYRKGEYYELELIIGSSLFIIIAFLPSLILLLLDRKNFWKIAT